MNSASWMPPQMSATMPVMTPPRPIVRSDAVMPGLRSVRAPRMIATTPSGAKKRMPAIPRTSPTMGPAFVVVTWARCSRICSAVGYGNDCWRVTGAAGSEGGVGR
jgi:hypothetical protein